jgi:hypothetical protein
MPATWVFTVASVTTCCSAISALLRLAALALAGLAIAVAGAYVPAQRAAASRIAPVLATE